MVKKIVLLLLSTVFVFGLSNSYAEDQYDGEQGNNARKDRGKASSEPVYPAYTGPKKRIAVTRFDNKVKGTYGNWKLGDSMAEMLTTELVKTGRFVVIERQALQDILGEQELGQTGVVKQETAAKVGQVLGAQIIVRGVVSEFEQNESGGGGGFAISGFRIGGRSSKAHVGVDIRLIDASTGQVLQSHNSVGNVESSGVAFGASSGNVDFGADTFKNAPIGQATRQAIHDAVSFIVATMEKMPFSAKVIKLAGGKVYINAGKQTNIRPHDKFFVYSKGEDLVDPDTGLKLGAEEKLIGTVEVREVQDKFSIGSLTSGNAVLKAGDILRFQ